MEQLLLAVAITIVVIIIMVKQLNNVTTKLDDEDEIINDPRLYANFASAIQEKIRAIRLGIETLDAKSQFKLLENANSAATLEKLSDMIRKLVFFETMMGKKNDSSSIETELFEILNELDLLISTSLENGEKIADDIREELASSYSQLKNRYSIRQL
ncbi:MAG: hypothetical protein LBJ88_02880 [Campylobacteraceae bacterium]|jgi:hypothetical protein|nr:hypothetical protein [Campylobacteraceae bacterium]